MFRYTLTHNVEGVYVLPSDPKGWKDAQFGITRSPKYHGVNYSQILSLAFICGAGKEFIDNIYNNYGLDEEIKILIEESCECDVLQTSSSYNSDYSDDYEKGGNSTLCDFDEIFTGILDLKEISIGDEETNVPLIEQGLNQKFKSRADTKIELFSNNTLDGLTISDIDLPYDLHLHSKALAAVGNYGLIDVSDQSAEVSFDDQFSYFSLPGFKESSEGDGFFSPTDTPQLLYSGNNAGDLPFFYQNSTGENQTVDILINVKGIIGWESDLIVADFEYTETFALIYGNTPVFADGATYINLVPDRTVVYFSAESTYLYNGYLKTQIILPPGQKIWIAIRHFPPGLVVGDGIRKVDNAIFTTSEIQISTINIADPSISKAQGLFETIARVCEGILDVPDPVRSSYYGRIDATPYSEDENGCGSFAAITSGVMIRQYPTIGDKTYGIQSTCNELFDTLDSIDNIGIGFEKWGSSYKLRWERKNFFYQNKEIMKLEHVPDIRRSIAQEYAYNDILIGFEKWQTTSLNGLGEYCSKSQYTLGMKSIDQTLEKLSPYIGSAYILEEIRRMPYDETATTDTDYDNDNFIIALNRSIGYDGAPNMLDVAEKDENFAAVENVLSPETAYNLRYTVSKNLLRNIPSIYPIVTKYPNRSVKFVYGEGNKFIVTQDEVDCPSSFAGERLAGNQDILLSESGEDPLFVAEYLDFKYPISREEYLSIKDAFDNPTSAVHNGYITISNETETYKGFLMELNYRQLDGLSTFKLIRKYD